jgi:hypothetical protein
MKTHSLKLLLAAAVALPLSACMSAADIAASDDAACRSTGAKPGTPAFAKCLEDRRERRRIAQIENDRSMQRMQWNMQQSAQRAAMPRM